jgi:hypothetical protein
MGLVTLAHMVARFPGCLEEWKSGERLACSVGRAALAPCPGRLPTVGCGPTGSSASIMNEQLDQRWRQKQPPFDGEVVVFDDSLTPSAMVRALQLIVQVLGKESGSEELRKIEDWHDHDGFIKSDELYSWAELRSAVTSVDSLRVSCSDDWMVHTLVYPVSLGFCLRYWIEIESDSQHSCCIDLSASAGTLDRAIETLRSHGVTNFGTESSASYFVRRDAS